MEDIYPILAKHFLNEASSDEEKVILEYKNSNPKEYTLLLALWNKGEVKVHDFDSYRAWEAFNSKKSERHTKVIPLFGSIRNMAAAVAFLIMGTFAIWYLADTIGQPETVVVQNTEGTSLEKRLSDGSVVWMNQGSSISYPKEFGYTRNIILRGEAFFEVVKDSLHPFVVTADFSTITVLGTSFNIHTDTQGTAISVKTGKVEVASLSRKETVVLLHDQSALATKDSLTTKNDVDPNYLSWKTGDFEFSDTPFAQVVTQLNTYYRDSLTLDPQKNYDCTLTAKFDRMPLRQVVEIIEATCGVSMKKANDNSYIIQ